MLRDLGDELRILLVRSKDGRHWVLPKGHIEKGETAEEAALREVREEAGVRGRIREELGMDCYALPAKEVRSVYYWMDFDSEGPADEDRELCWASPDEALERISFEGSRALIAELIRRQRTASVSP